jgi:hypothetical protein
VLRLVWQQDQIQTDAAAKALARSFDPGGIFVSKFILSNAMGNIPDDMLAEAMEVKKNNGRKWIIRAAACAAMVAMLIGAMFFWPGEIKTEDGNIISAPGILKVYACDLETTSEEALREYELTENEFSWRAVWAVTIMDAHYDVPHFGRPITFQMPGDYYGTSEITFCVSSEMEGFCKETVLANGEVFYLTKQVDNMTKYNIWKKYAEQDFYLDIIIYVDGKIAGYGVMSFYMNGRNGYCYAYKCATVCFPMVDGELQDVSEEYVWQKIAEYKQAQPEGQGAEFFRKLHENDE